MQIKKFNDFVNETYSILEGKEHSFADKIFRMVQTQLTEDENDEDKFYEKILDWAISFYDRKLSKKEITEADYKECIETIKPKLEEFRKKLSSKPKKAKKEEDEEED